MRPTKAGVGLAIVGFVCLSVGRIFGSIEMYYLAGMCVAAVLLAMLYTATLRLDLAVTRSATPARLRAGGPARVDLTLTNKSRRRTPTLLVQDRVQQSQGAVLALAPINRNAPARVAYRLPTSVRGPIEIGPLSLTLGDPLGLTKTQIVASGQVQLLVHPQLIPLQRLKASAGRDPLAEQRRARSLANSGDEFFALRPYMVGDELRRVHWPATARTGELVVRQDEKPRTGRVSVVLDHRSGAYDDDSFERAVSAALSVLYAAWNGEDGLRFSNSSNPNGVDIDTRADLNAVDQRLAYISQVSYGSLAETLEAACRFHGGGTLVVVTATPSAETFATVRRSRRGFSRSILVTTNSARSGDIDSHSFVAHDGQADFESGWRNQLEALGASR